MVARCFLYVASQSASDSAQCMRGMPQGIMACFRLVLAWQCKRAVFQPVPWVLPCQVTFSMTQGACSAASKAYVITSPRNARHVQHIARYLCQEAQGVCSIQVQGGRLRRAGRRGAVMSRKPPGCRHQAHI